MPMRVSPLLASHSQHLQKTFSLRALDFVFRFEEVR
jgi:hypothetical protein